jgi:hypothetical protein
VVSGREAEISPTIEGVAREAGVELLTLGHDYMRLENGAALTDELSHVLADLRPDILFCHAEDCWPAPMIDPPSASETDPPSNSGIDRYWLSRCEFLGGSLFDADYPLKWVIIARRPTPSSESSHIDAPLLSPTQPLPPR